MREKVKALVSKPIGYFYLLLVIGAVSYLVTSPALGFYWDDWQAVFLYKTGSLQVLQEYFQFDRPFSAWTYWLTFPVIPMTPIGWQILTVLIRVTAVWFLTQSLMFLWQDHNEMLVWFGVLLLVFPSFDLQSVSVAFNQHFFALLLFSVSIYTMIKAAVSPSSTRWLWGAVSLVAGAGQIVTMEYFIGLEFLRPLVIWIVLRNRHHLKQKRKLLVETTLFSLPYLGIVLAFAYWRFAIYPQTIGAMPTDDPNAPLLLMEFSRAPLKSLIAFANLALQDTVHLVSQSLLLPLKPELLRLDAKFNLLSWAIGLGLAGIFGYRAYLSSIDSKDATRKTFILQGLIVSVVAMFLGGLPVWITNRQALEGKWSERFTLAPMIGAVLFIIVIISWLIENRKNRTYLLVIGLGLSIAYQMQMTHKFALDWQVQRDYYWQMTWRVPAIKPGTVFLSANVPSTYSSHHSVGFALDLLYGGEVMSERLATWYLSPADEGSVFAVLAPNQPIDFKLRNITFNGSTSNAIGIMNKSTTACVLVLDEVYGQNPLMDVNYGKILQLSNLDQIDLAASPKMPEPLIFGEEPTHDWCYYFEKADLARQQEDWSTVVRLMDQARSSGFSANHILEYTPLFEAQYRLEDWTGLLKTTMLMQPETVENTEYLCYLLVYLDTDATNLPPQEINNQLNSMLDCSVSAQGNQ